MCTQRGVLISEVDLYTKVHYWDLRNCRERSPLREVPLYIYTYVYQREIQCLLQHINTCTCILTGDCTFNGRWTVSRRVCCSDAAVVARPQGKAPRVGHHAPSPLDEGGEVVGPGQVW